jgi:hypothetical protein
MPEGFIQLPLDGAGKRMRTRARTIGGQEVHEQASYRPGADTYFALADNVAHAANKHHISLFNGAASGRVVQVRKLFAVNLSTGAVTGVAERFDCRRSTAQTAGTAITPTPADSTNPALPAAIVCATGATVTNGALLWPFLTLNEEVTATQPLTTAGFQQSMNIMLEADSIQELTLRPGEGFTVQQITASTVGSFAWILAFTVDTP